MSEADLREQIRVLERVVAEQREALAPGTTPSRRARLLRNLDMVHCYIHEGWTQRELAYHFHLSVGHIEKLLESYQIPAAMRQVDDVKSGARMAQALAHGETLQQVADRHGVSPATIRRLLQRISILPPDDAPPEANTDTEVSLTPAAAVPPSPTREKIERNRTILRLVSEEGWTHRRVAEAFGICAQRVDRIVKRAHSLAAEGAAPEITTLHRDYLLYLNDQWTYDEFLAHYQLTRGRFTQIRCQHGWPVKREYQAMRPTRRCPACGVEKPATTEHFVATTDGRGFQSYCKPCRAAKARARATARRGEAPARRPACPPVTAFGETKALRAWIRDARCVVSDQTLRYRLHRGWPPERAITTPTQPKQRRGRVTAFGEAKTLREWADDARCVVTYPALVQRLHKQHWSLEHALVTPSGGATKQRLVTAFGTTQRLTDWVQDRRCVVTKQVLQLRLARGWDAEAAIVTPTIQASHVHRITAFGETLSMRAWSRDPRCGVSYHVLRGRIRKGWPPEVALTTPVGVPRTESPAG